MHQPPRNADKKDINSKQCINGNYLATTNIYINGNMLTNIKECDQMGEGWM